MYYDALELLFDKGEYFQVLCKQTSVNGLIRIVTNVLALGLEENNNNSNNVDIDVDAEADKGMDIDLNYQNIRNRIKDVL